MNHGLCTNCGFDPPKARDLCPACLEYERRHGVPRPRHLVEQHADRVIWRHTALPAGT